MRLHGVVAMSFRDSLCGEGIEEGQGQEQQMDVQERSERRATGQGPMGLEVGRVSLTLTEVQSTMPTVFLGWGDIRSGLSGWQVKVSPR